MNPSNFELLCDIHRESLKVFISHLKIHIQNKSFNCVKHILEQVKVPDEVLCYKLLRTTSEEIMNLLLTEKIAADNFIFSVLQKLPKDGTEISLDTLKSIIKNINYKNFSDDYKLCIILPSIKSPYSFLYASIMCSYKNSEYFINAILSDGIFNANATFLTSFLFILMQKNIIFEIQPAFRKSHMEIMKWLIQNLKKDTVGWTTGPDSGVWPSSNPEDYKQTYDLIQSYIKF